MDRLHALNLLAECTGDTIWPVDQARVRKVPEAWIEELAEAFESSFDRDRDTIYVEERPANQFHGIRDIDLAVRLAEFLGVQTETLIATSLSRRHLYERLVEAVEEL